MAVCELLYLGFFCISPLSGGTPPLSTGEVRADAWGHWPTAGVPVEAPGWNAMVVASTDSLQAVNPKAFSEVCEGAVCVRYHRHCAPEVEQKSECQFSILREGEQQPVEITVTTFGAERHRAALKSLSILTSGGVRFPLEAMSRQSTRQSPYCSRTGRDPQGHPKFEAD